MSTDLLTLHLPPTHSADHAPGSLELRGLDAGTADDLARCYLAAYPQGVAASDLAEAREEMEATFRGDYGELRADASASTTSRTRSGSIAATPS